jgi:sarcosine oxidase subunit alpha
VSTPFRAPAPAGLGIDRTRPLAFSFDGVRYAGYAGDTLAAALLANGVHLVARSFKYHRPRGILAAGAEEPNALVQLRGGVCSEPNARATQVELFEGLEAASQNRCPSLAFDLGALANAASRLLPPGFYYKTFMWPPGPRWWLAYERLIRRAAGMGQAPDAPDPDEYEHQHAHCDVLVVGGGAAGIPAAIAASRAGARVILCDEGARWGGSLLTDPATIDGKPGAQWVEGAIAELLALPSVQVLSRTTAFGWYDQNLVGLIERVQDHAAKPLEHVPRQRYWKVRAREIVLATGVHERPVAFADNDRPGVMLAGAMRRYARQFGVIPGRRVALFANNDSAYASALALAALGVEIAAVVDARTSTEADVARRCRAAGMRILHGAAVARARGHRRVDAVEVVSLGAPAKTETIGCDALGVSGGFNPVVHLFSQAGGRLRFDDGLAAFVPDRGPPSIQVVGAAAAALGVAAALQDGFVAGRIAAGRTGFRGAAGGQPRAESVTPTPIGPLWQVAVPAKVRGKRFVDFQNDVTTEDIVLAVREGYASIEHLKRYTTLGMGTDQGKTSNVVGAALLADLLHRPIAEVGTTRFRPPYTPVTLGALAGRERGAHAEPTRQTPLHEWHRRNGALFTNAGLWRRAQLYPREGEADFDCINREALNVRAQAGLIDVSSLGKIELHGPDVAAFLDRVYINRWGTLAIGRCRYGVMLREDGFVLDDGTVSRLAANRFLMTTTTANAEAVLRHLEYCLQVLWPGLRVRLASVTEQWAAAALSGPNARKVLAKVADFDASNEAFPFLAAREGRVAGIAARLLRISYSGELAYEIHVPADRGTTMWETVIEAGRDLGIQPYGTEAMAVLRIEKGHLVVGREADGRTTADDLGLGGLMAAEKDCIGKRSLARPALDPSVAPNRWQLVGLTCLEDGRDLPRGAKLVADPGAPAPNPMLGHATSSCYSPHLKAAIALGLLAGGGRRHGEQLWACSPLAGAAVRVRVGPPCFVDPEGTRVRA